VTRQLAAQSIQHFHTMLKAIGSDFEQCKRVENLGNFALPGQTFVQAASLHLATSNWEESDNRWDAVSKEVRPLERQPFHDDVHPHCGLPTKDKGGFG
jgi:hypothetical protein